MQKLVPRAATPLGLFAAALLTISALGCGSRGWPPRAERVCPLTLEALRDSVDGEPVVVESRLVPLPRPTPVMSHFVGPGEPTACLVLWGDPQRWGVGLVDGKGEVRFDHLDAPAWSGRPEARLVMLDDDERPELLITDRQSGDDGEKLAILLFFLGEDGYASLAKRLEFEGKSIAWRPVYEMGKACRHASRHPCMTGLEVDIDDGPTRVWSMPGLREVHPDAAAGSVDVSPPGVPVRTHPSPISAPAAQGVP